MSELLQQLTRNCFSDRDATAVAQEQAALWQSWLLPVTEDSPVGEDPGYHDDFLLMRDDMNKSTAQGVRLTLSRSIQRAAEGVAAESMTAG